MSDQGVTVSELALAVVICPTCGACAGESCAEALRRTAPESERAELELIARHAPHLAHPERLAAAERLVDSAVAYGLVERVPRRPVSARRSR